MSAYYNEFMDSYIGKGISLNIFNDTTHSSDTCSGEEKINASIKMILSTRPGERVFMPEFGSNLFRVVFEPNDMIAADMIKLYVGDSLQKWEKRIVVQSITVGTEGEENVVPVSIYYTFRNSNVSGCYVYPFNLRVDGSKSTYNFGTYNAN